MDSKDILEDAYGRILPTLRKSLKGLTQEELNFQPKPDSNSIGWLVWHLIRVHDRQVAGIVDKEQLWLSEGWHARFNLPADEKDSGFGHTPEQVTAFKSPDVETLLGYYQAVSERARDYFRTLSPADLDRELNDPRYQPPPTVGVRLISGLADNLQHLGQVSYLRGLLQGKGWQNAT